MLHDYQRQRVLTFLDPESWRSAGIRLSHPAVEDSARLRQALLGKGYLQGTQSHLNFLPEKQTDFIFTMLAEEFGLLGSLGVLGLYVIILGYCLAIALSARPVRQAGRPRHRYHLLLCVFHQRAVVMPARSVVGIPLPSSPTAAPQPSR
ncbi:MAG: FtsW/RodA/SpoVE family cell cycle protein [Rhodospirillales bacterium]